MENKVNDILENAPGNKYDVYYVLSNECLSNAKEPDRILRQILTYSKKIGAEDGLEPTNLSTEEIKVAEQKYIDLIDQIVQVLIQDNPSEEDFYKALYENVFFSKLLPQNSKAKAIFMKILSENIRFIPYYQAENLLQMSNEEYRACLEKVKPDVLKALYMLNRNFDTLTEIASQLYNIENGIDRREDKIIFISAILGIIMHKQQEDDATNE